VDDRRLGQEIAERQHHRVRHGLEPLRLVLRLRGQPRVDRGAPEAPLAIDQPARDLLGLGQPQHRLLAHVQVVGQLRQGEQSFVIHGGHGGHFMIAAAAGQPGEP
jgi:hypothetical protein